MSPYSIILGLFITTTAYASAQPPSQNPMSMLPMMVIFLGLFYLMILRPQKNRQKAHQQLINQIKTGDKVSTVGGIMGEIESIQDQVVQLKIAEKVVISVNKNSINQNLSAHTTPTDRHTDR
ncbi:MAG: preprotein translocase subunit YajC [Legionellales bacterium]|nr:preprotein translocase subunit YajC [Legionellales bacterium]|tara:strand:- start:25 stop:390 length:366 start_codon:yes stop_codon:yes gene_type:complete